MTIALFGWALINSLWQASAIAVVLAVTRVLMRRAGASARYAVALVALGATIVVPASTMMARQDSNASSTIVTTPSASQASRPSPERGHAAAATARDAGRYFFAQTTRSTGTENVLTWIVGVWLLGVVALSARLFGGIVRTRRLARNGAASVDEHVAAIAHRIAKQVGIRRAVRVLLSKRVAVPMVVGWVAPVVLVPASLLTGLTPTQLEVLLAHELAHIRRLDAFVNLAQHVVETLLFFHPAVWWISSRVRAERENCCDDLAIAVTGADRRMYGSTLLALEESRAAFLAVAATDGALLARVRRIVSGEPQHTGVASRWIPALVAIAAVMFVSGSIDARILGRGATNAIRVSPAATSPSITIETTPPVPNAPSSITPDSLHRRAHMRSRPIIIGAASLALTSGSVVPQSRPSFDGQWTFADCGGCGRDMRAAGSGGFGPGWGANVTIRQNDTELAIIDETAGAQLKTVYRLAEPNGPVITTGDNRRFENDPGELIDFRRLVQTRLSDLTLTQSKADWKGDTLVVPLTGVQDSTISIAFSMSLFIDAAGELNARWRIGRVQIRSGAVHFDFDAAVPSAVKANDTLTIRYRKR